MCWQRNSGQSGPSRLRAGRVRHPGEWGSGDQLRCDVRRHSFFISGGSASPMANNCSLPSYTPRLAQIGVVSTSALPPGRLAEACYNRLAKRKTPPTRAVADHSPTRTRTVRRAFRERIRPPWCTWAASIRTTGYPCSPSASVSSRVRLLRSRARLA